MANNVQIQNAALAGFIQGSAAFFTSQVAADYATLCNRAQAFAERVDSKIVADGAIVSPLTAAGNGKVQLLQSICAGVIAGRVPTSTVAADYDDIADAIFALYTQGVTELV